MNVSAVHEATLMMWSAMPPVQHLIKEAVEQQQKEKAEYQSALDALDGTVEGAEGPEEPEYTPLPTDTDKKAIRSAKEDVIACLANLHRASFVNALPADSLAAAKIETDLMMTGPDAKTVAYSSFQRYVKHLIIKKWADPRCLSFVILRPGTANTVGSTSRPGTSLDKAAMGKGRTAFEDYVHDLVRCVVDDREPCALLPLNDVWTRANYPLTVEQPFSKFAQLVSHPQYPAVYDELWDAAVGPDANIATKEQFALVVRLAGKYSFTNATNERSDVVAAWLWYNAICEKGTMSKVEFRRACRTMVAVFAPKSPLHQATRQSEEVAAVSLEAIVASAKGASCEGAQWIDAVVPPNPKATLLKDPQELFLHDELEVSTSEATYFDSATPNRILVTGEEGVGKSTLAKQLAQSLNCVHIDAEELAIQAVDTPSDLLGSQVKQLVARGSAIPLYLQAALIRRSLANPATRHKGYVCGDILPVNPKTASAFLNELGLESCIPQAIVRVDCPSALLEARLKAAKDRNDALYETEIETRKAEQGEIDSKAQAEKAKTARARRNADLVARKEALENKADDLTEEEQMVMEQQEEEEPEAEPEYDENGNMLEPEEIAERERNKKRATERRRFLAELHQQIVVGRRQLISSGLGTDPIDSPILANAKEICAARRRVVHVGCAEDPVALSSAVIERLSLERSCVPSSITLPEETAGELAAGDVAAYGEAVNQLIEESPSKFPFSGWGKYCPVTYTEDHVLFEGVADYCVVYRNRIYFLAGARRLELFVQDPHKYLKVDPTPKKSILLLKSRVDTFLSAATSTTPEKPIAHTKATSAEFEAQLAQNLNLTPTSLHTLVQQWKEQQNEFTIRQAAAKDRIKVDIKKRKEADDRLAKRLEAEAKRRKKEEKSKKKPKKGTVEAPKVQDMVDEDDLYAEPEEIIETTDMRLQKEIDAKKRAQEFTFAPQLVSLLDDVLSPEDLDYLFDLRALPETVIVLKHKVPKAVNIDATEEDEIAEEEGDDDSVEEEDEEEPEELDDDGEVIPKPPKTVDLTEPKQYKKFIHAFLQKLAAAAEAAEDDAGAPEEEVQEGEDAPPRPSQPFIIKTFNIYDRLTSAHLVSDVLYQVKPCLLSAAPLPDGEEVIAEDEPLEELEGLEEGGLDANPTNPLLIPGPRARHQYGRTGHFCPVTLSEKNVLVKGDITICAVYDHSKYIFATQKEMDSFLVNPLRYIPHGLPVAVPPPRLWVLGPKAAGKATVVSKLSAKYNIPVFASTDLAYYDELLAAATNVSGGVVRGVDVPSQDVASNWHLARAIALRKALVDFDDEQSKKAKKKADAEAEQEQRERLQQEGEDVDELDEDEEAELEEILAFEAEEEDVGAERKELAQRRICAALTRIEPFASKGYIMIGAPTSEGELQVLLDNKTYPDVVLHIKVSSEEYVKRRIETEVATQEEEFAAKTRKIEQLRRHDAERARRVELAKWRRRNIGADDEVPEEEDTEIPEDPEPVQRELIQADLEAEYDESSAAIAGVLELLPEKRLPLVEINGDGGFDTVLTHCCHALMPFVDARRSLVEAAQVVPHSEAVKALEVGAMSISSFRYADPVAVYERRVFAERAVEHYALQKARNTAEDVEEEVPEVDASKPVKPKTKITLETNEDGDEEEVEVPEEEEEMVDDEEEPEEPEPEPELAPEEIEEMQAELNEKKRIDQERTARKTAYFRTRVYTFDSDANLLKFIQSPVTYWDQPPPLPHVPAVVVVAESPLTPEENGSGKRLMGHHVANSMNSAFVDLPKLLKWALLHRDAFPGAIDEALLASVVHSTPIDSTTLRTLITARLGCADVLTKGAVLCNLLEDAEDANVQLGAGINFTATLRFAAEEDEKESHPALEAVDAYTRISSTITSARWTTKALVAAVKHINDTKEATQQRILRRELGYPLRALYAGIPEETIASSTTEEFGMYCPYTWVSKGQLISMEDDRRYTAEYVSRIFCFHAEEYLQEFLDHPEVYVNSGTAVTLPSTLPNRKSEEEVSSATFELFGCCPVTLYDTKNNVGLKGAAEPKATKGSLFVEYGGKYFAILDEACMERFLRQPWVYVDNAVLPMPHKLPMDPAVIKQKSPAEYITRTMYDGVARALISVADVRPKFPGLTAEESVRKYIALHLKAFNPDNSPIAAKQYMANFEEFSQIATLYKTVGNTPPSDVDGLERFNNACELWDAVQDKPTMYEKYQYLREVHADPEGTKE